MEIDAVKRFKFLKRMKGRWLIDPDTCGYFRQSHYNKHEYYDIVKDELQRFMSHTLIERYEQRLARAEISYAQIEFYMDCQPYNYVYQELSYKIGEWMMRYVGKVNAPVELRHIAQNKQSIHTGPVEKKTIEGIALLEAQVVPANQKTLAEIKATWLLMKNPDLVERTIEDMRVWGSRETVMHRTEHKYKRVLRGLWARIKSYQAEMRDELIQRLWEECSEAYGMCADGHVGRLVNVLSGFEDIKVKPTMEYFQNKIALIAALDEPLAIKMEKANHLMDELEMPSEQRQPWLDAF
jgi:hypothetical protein